ncbi:hypothetical protein NDU88_004251 [Pleurodeles waltl]|uniref:Uncharacterized protein n=1 Tax=Pleurodeles waltl TaxID=8319 RepID=A0AAV7WRS4_PLEWA|nr:hypothetical protein NDU88_004251 [Pleurodeles waltl]
MLVAPCGHRCELSIRLGRSHGSWWLGELRPFSSLLPSMGPQSGHGASIGSFEIRYLQNLQRYMTESKNTRNPLDQQRLKNKGEHKANENKIKE